MQLRLKTPGTADIVTLAEAKAHLRVFHEDDDTYITALCAAIRDHLSGPNSWLGRSVVPQTWVLSLEQFPPCERASHVPGQYPRNAIPLPKPPVTSIVSVGYTDGAADAQTIADFRHLSGNDGSYLLPARGASWPVSYGDADSVLVEFISGYATIPPAIKQAALLMIGHWYENREAATETKLSDLPMAVDALLYPYRHWPS